MTRFKSQSRKAVGIVLSHNEYGLVHESLKASIKSFKDNPEIQYEFQLILESIEKQAKCIVDIY
tara:strand:- start:279 stop:470 length:192 start_codon:yes stop_codon:yes gene_type:complete